MRSSDDDPLRLICFDDDPEAAARLADRVDRPGIDAAPTVTETATLEALEGGGVDCVVYSYRLAADDAAPVISRIRRSWPSRPIVLYSHGDVDPESIPLATATTADAFVDDPTVDALLETIRTHVDRSAGIDDGRSARPSDDYVGFESIAIHKADLLDELLECLPIHLYVKDESARHVLVSRAFHDPEVFLGNRDDEVPFADDDHTAQAYDDDRTVLSEGRPILDKEEYLPGLDRWNLSSKVPLFDADDEPIGLVGVTRDITRRKETQEELRRQNERLEKFAEIVSHDLRNPLSIATASVDLERAERDSARLDDAAAALERMSELIDEVLALARHGRTVVETSLVAVEPVLEAARSTIEGDVIVDVRPDELEVVADEKRLQRLFENLLSNAVEHAGPDATVTVGVVDGGDGLYVEDDGPGVPPDDRSNVFDPGWTDSETGTGFGLAIVREIADAHGWSIAVTDGSAGGARFELTGLEVVVDGQQ